MLSNFKTINTRYWERQRMMLFFRPIVAVACFYMIFFFMSCMKYFHKNIALSHITIPFQICVPGYTLKYKFPINADIQTNN